ncbi:LPS-assembly protein LptD [Thiocystis violacea]|uniref:LPS-assembly protein LptD n=1 Tax=Thiocystis violacea TaxID=13725 RepID=UPI001F5BA865|nr:LPS-assembly protein LptD [Thiocystis violacea]
MANLKGNVQSATLLILLVLSPPSLPKDQTAAAEHSDCTGATDAGQAECQATPAPAGGASVQQGASATQAQPPDPEEEASARGEIFQPTPPEADDSALPTLTPSTPTPGDPGLGPLEPRGPSPKVDEPATPPAPTGPPATRLEKGRRSDDERLHAGLTWDYCGPKPGVNKLASMSALTANEQQPIDITADRVGYDQNADLIDLLGNVEILQEGRRFESDRSSYDRHNGDVKAAGHVFLEYPGVRLTGESAQYNLETKKGTIEKPGYRMSGNANLRGEAEQAWLLNEQQSRYRDIIYTTCPPGNADWSILASDLELDQAAGLGTARHARIRIADIPVLYTPYLRFPIDGRRRSGLLIPTFGSSDSTGTDISLPYYWNIAPNMDATITPRYMSMRGLMLGAQFRHLSSFQRIEIDGEILPHDQQAPDDGVRSALRIKENGHLGSRWTSSIDYASVSDDAYLEDFGNRLDVTSIRNLSQRGDIRYNGEGWRLLGRLQQFQTVDASIEPADRPYGQLPHIELAMDPDTWKEFLEYDFDSQYDYFDHSAAVHGNRLVAIPSLRIPLRRSFGYLIPRTRLYYTGYDLVEQEDGAPDQLNHLIPSMDIDGKLIFEREANWLGNSALQTLEPRLYYVLTPYEDQADNPLFDTTALDFSFASLFRPNRFTGYDRIGDANRLTVGVTSRTINHGGEELLRASLGQIYYFDNPRVQLEDDSTEDDISSSLASELSARLHPDWTATASLQWNPHETEQPWEKQVLQLRYAPDRDHLINLAYRYNLGNTTSEAYENTDLSFQMPVTSDVRLVGRWLYSMLNDETVEAFAGVEFGRCCWRLRLLGQHLKSSADETASTSVMLQLELAGLGSFGNQIDKLLERGIYGYQSE